MMRVVDDETDMAATRDERPSEAIRRSYRAWVALAWISGLIAAPSFVGGVWLLLRGERWAFLLGVPAWAFVECVRRARAARAGLR